MSTTKKVTFSEGLPLGPRATFTHEGQLWIAYPASRHQKFAAVIDRLIGIHSRITTTMVDWVNSWPEDAERVVKIVEMTNRAQRLGKSVTMEKIEAFTGLAGGAATASPPDGTDHGPCLPGERSRTGLTPPDQRINVP